MNAHMSDTMSVSSQHSSPVKKTVLAQPHHNQQLENDFQLLQTKINDLKYKNIKLQLDLQNRCISLRVFIYCNLGDRPERQELRQAQKRVKQLEQELTQCK